MNDSRPVPAPYGPPPARAARLVALWVDLAPIAVPWLPLLGILLAGQRDWGVFWLMVMLGVWSGVAGAILLLVGAGLLSRRGQTLGMAYVGLSVIGATPRRRVFAAAAVWGVPLLVGALGASLVFAFIGNDQDLQLGVLVGTSLALYALNWLFWLGPARRTLGDRLSGGQVAAAAATDVTKTSRPPTVWPDLLLIAPPVLALPLVAQFPGGLAGDALAILIAAFPVAFRRWRK